MFYKQSEIIEYAQTQLKEYLEYNDSYLTNDIAEIHHDLFNTDYYLIYYSECNKWLGNHAFECIGIIQDYEKDNFGEVTTDLSSSESVVNMYVYIVGEHILEDVINDVKKEMEV